ncbi:hypothetical protein [Caballeronia udeis]
MASRDWPDFAGFFPSLTGDRQPVSVATDLRIRCINDNMPDFSFNAAE